MFEKFSTGNVRKILGPKCSNFFRPNEFEKYSNHEVRKRGSFFLHIGNGRRNGLINVLLLMITRNKINSLLSFISCVYPYKWMFYLEFGRIMQCPPCILVFPVISVFFSCFISYSLELFYILALINTASKIIWASMG